MESKFFPLDDHSPYSDRKLARDADFILDNETIVAIQRMGCDGKNIHEIYDVFASQGVTTEQIMAVLAPPEERTIGQARRQMRANVGFAGFKGRMR